MSRFGAKAYRRLAVGMATTVLTGSALLAFTAPAASAAGSKCTVLVQTTDQNGKVDPDVDAFEAPCRPGESNGDIEIYNPYTDTYTVQHDVPLAPISSGGSSGGGSGGSGTSTGSGGSHPPTSNCTPVAPGGTKIHKPTTQLPGHSTCPSQGSRAHPSR